MELRDALKASLKMGLILGLVSVFIALTGIVEDFNKLDIISGVIGLGHGILLLVSLVGGYVALGTGEKHNYLTAGLMGGLTGLLIAIVLTLLVILIHSVNIRTVFVNATEDLVALLILGKDLNPGVPILLALSTALGVLGGILSQLPSRIRTPLVTGLGTVLLFGVLQEVVRGILLNFDLSKSSIKFLLTSKGLAPTGALLLFVLAALINAGGPYVGPALRNAYGQLNPARKSIVGTGLLLLVGLVVAVIFLRLPVPVPEAMGESVQALLVFALFGLLPTAIVWLWPFLRRQPAQRDKLLLQASQLSPAIFVMATLPFMLGLYWSDVFDNFGLFVLMGLGLNIVVGFAGLLDLGYVAFYAIGAYAVGVLTSPRVWLGAEWSFWAAWPVAFVIAALAGIILGVPVLRMRGDYLAIVTLGFGEIIRVLALSDFLKPYFGGAQGILAIPKPQIAGLTFLTSQHIYYVIVAGCLVTIFISWRLKDSRVGRAWVAIREDEDVAQAMGINLVKYKLMAFAIGALFAGMSGAIFAAKLSSIYPHSFNLIVSINVLCLVIVGGLASIPGVIVGAWIMLFLPEVLRFAAEYRYMLYGVALVVMMLVKPEGFWPAARHRQELRGETETAGGEE